jgi:hypothetical protein
MRVSARRRFLAVSVFAAFALALALVPPAPGMHVRPKHASPFKVPLVPAFNACTSPNRVHGPPLEFQSCNPPVPSSAAVTVGTPENNAAPDNSVGNVKLTAQQGVPGPPDDSDILMVGSVTDVRCIGGTSTCGNANLTDGADYTGQLQGNVTVRMSDHWNSVAAGGGAESATMVDIPFPMPFNCVNTVDNDIGGLCSLDTSVNAVVPGGVRDGKRGVWELGQVNVSDGGPDGSTSTTPNFPFLRQGVFVP